LKTVDFRAYPGNPAANADSAIAGPDAITDFALRTVGFHVDAADIGERAVATGIRLRDVVLDEQAAINAKVPAENPVDAGIPALGVEAGAGHLPFESSF